MKRFFLTLILLLAFVLRVVWLDKFPVGFTPDEASFGYDAYSILKTGKDQWGQPFPIVLESFGDFKSPLYAYLTVPSVAIFGLNQFAVRLPNAILGTFAVLATYLLAKEFFKDKKIGILPAFMLAISPWHVQLSRGAFEANLTTLFLPLGIFLFLRGRKNKKLLFLSALVFGLNLFTYHSAKIVTPVIIAFLMIAYKKFNPVFIIIFSVFLGLTIYSFSLGAGRRAKDINIYNGSLLEAAEKRISWINSGANPVFARAVYNKYSITLKRFSDNYFSYFSPKFLFLEGPAEGTYGMIPGRGVLYGIEFVFLFGFVYYLITIKDKLAKIVLFWILIAPIPASLTSGVGFAANRVAVMMPAIQIASALGMITLINILTQKKNKKLILLIYSFTYLILVSVFVKDYFVSSNTKIAKQMLFGNLESMTYVSNTYPKKNVIVSTQLSEPNIYWAFVTKFDPKVYQEFTKSWNYKEKNLPFLDQLPEYKLGKVTFKRIDWKIDPKNADVLVGRPGEFPKEVVPTKITYYPGGEEAIYAKTF